LVAIICWTPAYILRLLETINLNAFTIYNKENKEMLEIYNNVAGGFISLEGFCTSILYGYDFRI